MDHDSWQEAIRVFLNSKARRSEHTGRAYRRAMSTFLLHIRPLGPGEVGGADVDEWANEMTAELAPATVAARLAAVSAFYQYCMTMFTNGDGRPLASFNPVAQVERPAVQKYGKSRPLSVEQLTALLGVVDRGTVQGMRDYAMILMGVYTGRRSSEIRRWTVGYIQHNARGTVRYCWKGKRGKSRWDDLPSPVWAAIRLYWAAAGREPGLNEPVFIAHNGHDISPLSGEFFNQMIKRWAVVAGLPEWVHVHTLRHTAASLRLKAKRGVLELNRLLGHELLRTTQIYMQAMTGFVDEGWGDVERLLGGAKVSNQQQGNAESSQTPMRCGLAGGAVGTGGQWVV